MSDPGQSRSQVKGRGGTVRYQEEGRAGGLHPKGYTARTTELTGKGEVGGSWDAGSKRSSPGQKGEQAKGGAPTPEVKPGGVAPFLTHLLPHPTSNT